MDKLKHKLEERPEYVILLFSAVFMAIVMLGLVIGYGLSEQRWWYTLYVPLTAWTVLYLAWLKKQ